MKQMLTLPSNDKLNVLITRPEKKARSLATSITSLNITCTEQPLFDYLPLAGYDISEHLLTSADIMIFVSVAAVEFAHAVVDAKRWHCQHIVAVGQTTKVALTQLGFSHVLCPNMENSEGLLRLPVLSANIRSKNITIVRGNGGREHLASQLRECGAHVNYLESYQRVWRAFSKDISKQWFEQQINCIVVTSNVILEKLIELTVKQPEQDTMQPLISYWRTQCLWLVASQRIADQAKHCGCKHVIISEGASDQAITDTLRQLDNQ